jgi:arrestin-1
LGGELAAELPFVLMHPKPGSKPKLIAADSQAEVETFRQDTVDIPEAEE